MAITVLTKDNEVKLADALEQKEKKVMIDFFAEWCGPCKMLAPVLHEIDDELGDEVNIIKIDIDQHPEIAARYDVQAVPTLLFVQDGKIRHTEVGFLPKQAILAKLNG